MRLVAAALAVVACHHVSAQEPSPCQTLTTQEGFDLAQYIQARWYSQQQRPSPFQPAELNYCTTADYFDIDPTDFGYMDDYSIGVFNTAQDAQGNIFTSDDEAQVGPDPGPLCGLQDMPDTDPAKLQVGNCFGGPQGPYWVLEYDEAAGYAIISGGQPTIPTTDGLCTYPSPFNGLWIFTRDPSRDEALIAEATAKIIAQGIDPSTMLPVNQEGCEYPPVPTPPPEPTSPPSSSVTLTPANFDGCMAVNGAGVQDDNFLLANCDPSDARQQFLFESSLIRLALDDTMCVQAGRKNPDLSHGHKLRVFPCDASKPQQLFSWVPPDGALTLVEYSGLTVVFQGTTANIGIDRIIVGDLSRVGARKNWEIFS
jgi:lipocalin